MSVSATSKVSSSSSPLKRTERRYGTGAEGNPLWKTLTPQIMFWFGMNPAKTDNKNQLMTIRKKETKRDSISASPAFVSSAAIEALSASGVYEISDEAVDSAHHKVNVYDNNKAIIGDDNDNAADNPYLKHLYEKTKF